MKNARRRKNKNIKNQTLNQSIHDGSCNFKKARKKKKANMLKFILLIVFIFLIVYLAKNIIPKIKQKNNNNNNHSYQTSVAVEVPQDKSVNIVAIGDIMCHTSNFKDAYNAETNTYDFSYVFEEIQDYIKNADLAVGNLETTFSGKQVGYSGYPTFNTPEQLAQNLKDLGIDVVSTANNHSLDKRYNGLVSTLDELDKVNIKHTGTFRSQEEQNTILTEEINGIKFAFLSFTYGTNGIPVPKGKEYCINLIDEKLILDQIEKAKAVNPDVLCVCMHWGEEYKIKQNATQEKLANLLFKNGVDIIFGNHSHVLEPMEKRTITLDDGSTKDGFVIYSLGNFMSGQSAENTQNSALLQLKVTKHPNNSITIDSYDYIPTFMYHEGTGENINYKIIDINKAINDYDNNKNNISENLYNRLKKEKSRIDSILKTEEPVKSSSVFYMS